MTDNAPFSPSDLPLTNGKAYHLGLKPDELAKDIIIVGDPERVPLISDEFFGAIEVDRSNRGLRTITGTVKDTGQRVSIVTSGMGTPSIEIVLNEIVALHEIDFHTMTRKAECDMLTIIRVGTSGGIQPDTELGTLIITDYVIGLDNTGLFYDVPYTDNLCTLLEEKVRAHIDSGIQNDSRFKGKIFPYASQAHQDVIDALAHEARALGIQHKKGITVSNSGFFANQGRAVSRVRLTVPELDGILASMDAGIAGLKIENMEMEASFLLHFIGTLGYRAGVICPVIDKRSEGAFMKNYTDIVKNAGYVALKALHRLAAAFFIFIKFPEILKNI
ncbi:MAG: nucleoside phosphorylase [Nitrospirota bacterium]